MADSTSDRCCPPYRYSQRSVSPCLRTSQDNSATCANRPSSVARALRTAGHCYPATVAGSTAWIAASSPYPWSISSSAISVGNAESLPAIIDVPDTALLAVPNVQRPIGCLRHSIGSRDSIGRVHQRSLPREPAREYLEITRRLPV